MPNMFVVLVETTDKEGEIKQDLLTYEGETYIAESLAEALEDGEAAKAAFPGAKLRACKLLVLESIEI